jgi:DNA-binding LacI/PurR family transcriptional regulator
MSRSLTPNIKDVAEYAGVSISTVSHVLNNTKSVSKKLEERVREAVRVLNYETNPIAKGLKSKKTNTISVIVPSISSVFFPLLLRSIHVEASKFGYTVSIFETRESLEREKACIHLLKSLWTDGILLSSCADIDDPKSREYIESLSSISSGRKKIPIICMEAAISDKLDAVIMNDSLAIEEATAYLLSIDKKNIAYIAAPLRYVMGKNRKKGYINALKKAGLPALDEYIVEGDYSPQSGYTCMQRLLARMIPIDAVVVGNDQMAVGAIRCIKDANLRIPEDIAVVGFNNNFPSSLISPSLTTMKVPKEEMGMIAFDLFMNRINNPTSPRKLVELKADLIIRKSTDINGDDTWDLNHW